MIEKEFCLLLSAISKNFSWNRNQGDKIYY